MKTDSKWKYLKHLADLFISHHLVIYRYAF